MSNLLMKILLVEYLIIVGVCAYERNYIKLLYWISASGLQLAVLWGIK